MHINPLHAIDFYKADHRRQYPAGTTLVYSNLTARSKKHSNLPDAMWPGGVVFFGLQHFCRWFLADAFEEHFFSEPVERVVGRYQRRMDTSLGKGAIPAEHIEALHRLGYLPICIRAVSEGTVVPVGVPMLTIHNTHPDFAWLTNYLETALSAELWKPITSATVAHAYRRYLNMAAELTGGSAAFVQWQGHDFSARGMSGIGDGAVSGAGHLLSFTGTDTVSAIDMLEDYYGADAERELIGGSVPATEHSVMCMGGKDDEIGTFRRLITELYPSGVVSIVSDTWDFWKVVGEYAAMLRPEIMARNGKVVFRPDSGDPVQVLAQAIRVLWETFGGTVNAKGYKELDPHVGLIYGDSITPERCMAIVGAFAEMGFASTNVVFGIGSYTYQHVTRDTFGMAVKSTYGEVNGEGRPIFKDPVTDTGKMKKSRVGLLHVVRDESGVLTCRDNQSSMLCDDDAMETVWVNGKLTRKHTLAEIRARLARTST